MKFPYELPFLPGSSGPKRWDVVVFHYPEKPETELHQAARGPARRGAADQPRRHPGPADRGQRRVRDRAEAADPPGRDADARLRRRASAQGPRRQARVGRGGAGGAAWKQETEGVYATEGAAGSAWADLRYRHLVPDPEQWAALEKGSPLPRAPRATLITDFYSYNTNISQIDWDHWSQAHDGWLQPNWVGDLTVSCRVDVASAAADGKLRLELVEAGVANRCEVDLATGIATLFHGETELGRGPDRAPGRRGPRRQLRQRRRPAHPLGRRGRPVRRRPGLRGPADRRLHARPRKTSIPSASPGKARPAG